MAGVQEWRVPELAALVRRAANFRELPDTALAAVLDMLAGLYPSHEFAELRPRILWDREHDVISGRRGASMLAAVNAGTIPDRGLFAVYLGADGPRVGELDEEMVHESQAGQTLTLGATTWRIQEITRDRVIVEAGARRDRQAALLAWGRSGASARTGPRARRIHANDRAARGIRGTRAAAGGLRPRPPGGEQPGAIPRRSA